MSQQPCELCGVAAEYGNASEGLNYWVDCPACGSYRVAHLFRSSKPRTYISERDMVRLRGVVREASDADPDGRFREVITTNNYERILARHDEPRTPLEQMDRLLVYVAENTPFVGAQVVVNQLAALARRLYVADESQMPKRMRALGASGFASLGEATSERVFITLTMEGWERADRLRKTPRRGNQAFAAMWFHPEMDVLFDDGIAPALKASGYAIPYRVDRTAHQNKIDDEIIANIRKSRLVIADFTGIRPNVFYEAGFAMGLGIPTIFTCAANYVGHFVAAAPNQAEPPAVATATWFKQISDHAFDVRQYPALTWDTPADLSKKLSDRIQALGLALPLVQGS